MGKMKQMKSNDVIYYIVAINDAASKLTKLLCK